MDRRILSPFDGRRNQTQENLPGNQGNSQSANTQYGFDLADELTSLADPLGRLSRPADVANAALYLASDEAEFISGVCLEVDGARCV